MTDTITVPRALLEQALEISHDYEKDYAVRLSMIREALRCALEQPQQEPLADALRLLRVAIQTGYPEYGPEDWIDMIDTALAGRQQQEKDK